MHLLHLSLVVIHQTALKDNCLFLFGKALYIKGDILNGVLCDYLSGNLLCAVLDSLTDTWNINVVAVCVVELSFLVESEGKNAPVDAVASVTLGCEFIADICETAEHLLA